jgi:TonB family protein
MQVIVSVLRAIIFLSISMLALGVSAGNLTSSSFAQSTTSQASTPNTATTDDDDIDFDPYIANLKRRIKRLWTAPPVDTKMSTIVGFQIDKQGIIFAAHFTKNSGDTKVDAAALKAVLSASPVLPLPRDYKGDAIEINLTFSAHPPKNKLP